MRFMRRDWLLNFITLHLFLELEICCVGGSESEARADRALRQGL